MDCPRVTRWPTSTRIPVRLAVLSMLVTIAAIAAGGVFLFGLPLGAALLLGAILALPVTAAARDVVRYLFRRLSPPEEAGSMEALGRDLGIEAPPPPPALGDRPTAPAR